MTAARYDAWAQRIVSGDWLGSEVFYQSPLYPYVLAVIFRILGHHLFAVRVIQSIWGAASCVLIAIAGERWFDRRAGLAAGIVMALYGPAIFADVLIQKSSLDLLLMAGLLYALGASVSQPRWPHPALAGVTAGLLSINRENARILIPLVALWMLMQRRTLATVIFLIACAAIVLPVGLRNYAVGSELVLSTSQAGPNFYIGNHLGASGLYESLVPDRGNAKYEREDAQRLAEQAAGRRLSPGEVSTYWIDRTFDEIRREPGSWLRLLGRKLLLSINAREAPDAESLAAYAEYSPLLAILSRVSFGLLLPLAVLGAWIERARWRQLWLLHAFAAALLLSMAAFFVFGRYRLPLVPVLALFAAVPLSRMLAATRASFAGWRPGLVLAALAAVGCWIPIQVGGEETLLNIGEQLIADGRPGEAIPPLQQSVAQNPNDARDVFTLGVAYDHAGDKSSALAQFRRAVMLDPGNGRSQGSLALALKDAGELSDSLPHFAESVRISPADPSLRTNYGIALLQSGQPEAATEQLREAVRLRPDDAAAHNALGSALGQIGDLQQAVESFRAAVKIDPNDARTHANLGLALAELYLRAGRREPTRARRWRARSQ